MRLSSGWKICRLKIWDSPSVDVTTARCACIRRSYLRQGQNAQTGRGDCAVHAAARDTQQNVLITRADKKIFAAVKRVSRMAKFHDVPGVIAIERNRTITGKGTICVVSAGTSDIPVAEEAVLTAQLMGNRVERLYDVGVAGGISPPAAVTVEALTEISAVIICVAGMEGALPSVVGGLVSAPVIAVPTSVGYGASFGGVAALLGMLNSCASNVTVVNIDNGFGAARVASCINRI